MIPVARPRTRRLTVIAQDPSIRVKGRVLTTEVEIPAEEIAPGPRGYRVQVVDYDTSSGVLYQPRAYPPLQSGQYLDPFKEDAERPNNDSLVTDPRFHEQNVYAIVMKTLARFEFALGRRISWGFPGHQINVAPHAFADANAFYSKHDQALVFGYFKGLSGQVIFSCLSHDVVAHETTHAILDGLRNRYTDPSSPEQAGFHEGFSDVVALLSVFSLTEVVATLLQPKVGKKKKGESDLIDPDELTIEKLRDSVLLGLAKQMGSEMEGVRGNRAHALRRSVKLRPLTDKDDRKTYEKLEEFQEPHRRGEILVAAMLNAFLQVFRARIDKLERGRPGANLDLKLVVEQGADAADQLLTMAIRALDYAPPTDLQFRDYLSALITADRELVPDDGKYQYRKILLKSFRDYGIEPASFNSPDGSWEACNAHLTYDRSHFESMMRDPDEVFRFIWENREELKLEEHAYTKVTSVRPCLRIGPDGFALRETVVEYIQMVTLQAQELQSFDPPIGKPEGMSPDEEVTLYGGASLIFDEYGRLKYQILNRINNSSLQTPRLKYLWKYGYFADKDTEENLFARLHLSRALNLTRNVAERF
ncbi:MAG TPA: hypothetical protein VIF64_00860 [Pyrinomonadaceae bacterium]|jgi:hypothetical protein